MRASSIAASACPECIIAHSAYSDLGPPSSDPVCAARTDDATMPCASPAPVDAIGLRRSVFPSMSTELLGHGAWSRPMGNRAVVTLSTRLPDRELLAREGTARVADASRRRFVLGLFLKVPPKLFLLLLAQKHAVRLSGLVKTSTGARNVNHCSKIMAANRRLLCDTHWHKIVKPVAFNLLQLVVVTERRKKRHLRYCGLLSQFGDTRVSDWNVIAFIPCKRFCD